MQIQDYHDFSDTEILNKKSTKCNVLDLVPTEKVRSQSWSRYNGFPIPKYVTSNKSGIFLLKFNFKGSLMFEIQQTLGKIYPKFKQN